MDYYNLANACAVSRVRKDMAIDEATYYGRNSELIKCEGYLQNIINLVRSNGSHIWAGDKVSENFDAMSRSFEKLFGFEEVMINNSSALFEGWYAMAGNAFTIMRGNIFRMERVMAENGKFAKVVKIDKNHMATRLKNGKGWNLRICISYTFFCDYGEYSLTAREILAIILHEIGHNFYGDVNRTHAANIIEILEVLTIPEISDMMRVAMIGGKFVAADIFNAITDFIDNLPGNKGNLRRMVMGFQALLSPGWQKGMPILQIYNAFVLIEMLSAGIMVYSEKQIAQIMNPLSWFRGIINYDQEKYADAFAAAYGYGPDQASALDKLTSEYYLFPSSTEYSPMIKFIGSTCFAISKVIFLPLHAMDMHPSNAARQKNMLTYLEQVDAKKLPPALRKEYMAEMKRAQQDRIDAKNYEGYDTMKKWNRMEAIIQDMVQMSDPRELLSTIGANGQKYENLDFD